MSKRFAEFDDNICVNMAYFIFFIQFETAGYVGNKMITVSRSKNQNSNTANIRIFDVYEKNGIMLKSSTGEIYISYKIFLKNE